MLVTLAAGPKQGIEAAAPTLDAIWGTLAPHVNGAYANFLSSATEMDVAATYPAQTLRRLAALKRRYDPGNVFARNHNVRPSSSRPDHGTPHNQRAPRPATHAGPRRDPVPTCPRRRARRRGQRARAMTRSPSRPAQMLSAVGVARAR